MKYAKIMDEISAKCSEESAEDAVCLPPGHVRQLAKQFENQIVNSENIKTDDCSKVSAIVVIEDEKSELRPSEKNEAGSPLPEEDSSGVAKLFNWVGSGFSSFKSKEKRPRSRPNSQFYSDVGGTSTSPVTDCPERFTVVSQGDDGSMEFAPLDSDADSVQNVEPPTHFDTLNSPALSEAHKVAREIVSSERKYVDVLKLLNVDFRNLIEYENHISKNKVIPPCDLQKILNQFPELQHLNEDILQDLEARLKNWGESQKIADIIAKKGAFLKIYTVYSQNFLAQTSFLDDCCGKYVKFGNLVREFEASERCQKLALRHYMLKPIQRLPQYRLLLTEYLKQLTETSPDYEDTLSALRTVSEAADHVNNSMSQEDKKSRMMQLQSMASDFQVIEPGRSLIKDGLLQKVCRKTLKERHVVLLNDLLVYFTLASKSVLKYPQILHLDGMKVEITEDDMNLNTFVVLSTKKSIRLCARTEGERKEWVTALRSAISDYVSRKKSFLPICASVQNGTFKLGREAPLWIPDGKVSMCQLCAEEFSALFRRHHCRACGRAICWKCSDNEAPLQYKAYKPRRVCYECFYKLLEEFEVNAEDIKKSLSGPDEDSIENEYLNLKAKFVRSTHVETVKQKKVPTWLKEVAAKDADANISGWLRHWKPHKSRLEKNWYVLKEHVLYVYAASEDVVAITSIPVVGYKVERGNSVIADVKPEYIIQLIHTSSSIVFVAETTEAAERFVETRLVSSVTLEV